MNNWYNIGMTWILNLHFLDTGLLEDGSGRY